MSKKEEILHKLNTEDRSYIKEKFKEKDQKIADLETKLAESEKDRLMWQEMYKSADRQNKNICETDIYPLQEENNQLKQQLAEKDAEVQSWKDGTMVVKLGKLEEQLAEKEKEIEIEKKVSHWLYDIYNRTKFEEEVAQKYKTVTEITKQCDLYEHCKNQYINDLRSEVKKKLKD